MKRVEIYSQPDCSYCQQAKKLLEARGIAYQERDISQDEEQVIEMVRRTGGRTLPQILIRNRPIGGFAELRQLDSSQQLDNLLHH